VEKIKAKTEIDSETILNGYNYMDWSAEFVLT